MANQPMDRGRSFEFGVFRFSARGKQLTRNEIVVPLGSRALDILAFLLDHAGQTVGKDALMAAVWPDRVVEESNLTVHVSALRRVLEAGGVGAGFIHTDPGRGYRFAAPVVQRLIGETPVGDAPVGETKHTRANPVVEAPSPAAGDLAAASPRREKPSIAVLPFDNISSDSDQAYFADGMVEDIITELSRSRSLFVMSRNSSFTYRGKTIDIRQAAAELGVRYVLEGSVRRNASRVRVNAQLIDAETGGHVWAERYDRDVSDVFAVQDEITHAVTMAIGPAVAGAEQLRAARLHPENLGAWEAFHRGMWHLEQVDPESNTTARALFEQAIALDPRFGAPHAWVVHTYLNEIYVYYSRDNAEAVRLAECHGLRALALDPNDSAAHAALAWTAAAAGDLAGGLARSDRALAINPNNVEAHRCRASTLIWLGRMEEARDICQLCLRLSPRDVRSWISLHHLTMIGYLTRDYEAAVQAGLRVLDTKPTTVMPHRWLAAALGQLGRQTEAADVIRRATKMVAPWTFGEYARENGPWMAREQSDHLLEGLRRGGWTG
jgi:adenylate cyclase